MKPVSLLRLTALASLLTLLLAPPLFSQWEPDVRLTYNDSVSYDGRVAANSSIVHVVWWDGKEGVANVFYKRSTDNGVSWEAEIKLTNSPGGAVNPSIALSYPMVHIVWNDFRDGNYEIYYKKSTDSGTTWGADTRLTYDTTYSLFPKIIAFGSLVHVVWEDWKEGHPEIYAVRSTDNGTTWGTIIPLTNARRFAIAPSVSTTPPYVHVLWDDSRDGNHEIYYKRSTDDGLTWGLDTRLTNDSSYSGIPTGSASGALVHMTWFDGREGSLKTYYKRSTDEGFTWGPDIRLTDNPNSYPSTLVASVRNIHVVWRELVGGNEEIFYKESTDDGTSWGSDTRLTYGPSVSRQPSVTVSGPAIHVVWWDLRDGNPEIYYKRNPTGNIGVEETSGESGPWLNVRLKAIPNPYTSFASVPGHSSERFSLYDISGRKVGVYRGDRIGFDLSAGVYFLRPEGKDAKPLRVVKVR